MEGGIYSEPSKRNHDPRKSWDRGVEGWDEMEWDGGRSRAGLFSAVDSKKKKAAFD